MTDWLKKFPPFLEDYPDDSLIELMEFTKWYNGIHGYLCIIVCVCGLACNVINLLVLTRKTLTSPINSLLTALAVADLLVELIYLPYVFYFYHLMSNQHQAQNMFVSESMQTYRAVSASLTVTLSVFCFIFICHHQRITPWCFSLRRVELTIVAVSLTCILLYIPHYAMVAPDLIYLVIFSWIPFLALVILCILLIRALYITKHRANVPNIEVEEHQKKEEEEHMKERYDTAKMTVVLVVCYLIIELPHVVVTIMSEVHRGDGPWPSPWYSSSSTSGVLDGLAEVWEMTTMVNAAIKFYVYYLLYKQYRETINSYISSHRTINKN